MGDRDREYDVILYCTLDGTRISAHRDVLSRSSSYFEAMFSSGMIEANEKQIILNEIPGLILSAVVTYCYFENLTIDNMEILAEAADFFQLKDNALEKCIELMSKNLCVENCVNFILTVEKRALMDLLNQSMEFTDVFFDSLRKQDAFYEISVGTLKNILKRNTLEASNEQFVFDTIVKWYKHDKPNRKNHLPELMKLVHLPCLDRSFIASFFLEFCTEHDCFGVVEAASKYLSQNDNTLYERSNSRMSDNILAFDNQTIQVYSEKFKTWSTFTTGKCAETDVLSFNNHWMERIEFYFPIYSDGCLTSFSKIKLWNRQMIIKTPLLFSTSKRITQVTWVEGENCKLYVVADTNYHQFNDLHSLSENWCFQFNPANGVWTKIQNIFQSRSYICVLYSDGYLYVLGAQIQDIAEVQTNDNSQLCRYSLVENIWEMCPHMNDDVFVDDTVVAASVNGCIYVVGNSASSESEQIVYCFNPETDSWNLVASLNVPCQYMKACGTNKFLYIVSGETWPKSMFRYDPIVDKWTELDSLRSMNYYFYLLNASNFV